MSTCSVLQKSVAAHCSNTHQTLDIFNHLFGSRTFMKSKKGFRSHNSLSNTIKISKLFSTQKEFFF